MTYRFSGLTRVALAIGVVFSFVFIGIDLSDRNSFPWKILFEYLILGVMGLVSLYLLLYRVTVSEDMLSYGVFPWRSNIYFCDVERVDITSVLTVHVSLLSGETRNIPAPPQAASIVYLQVMMLSANRARAVVVGQDKGGECSRVTSSHSTKSIRVGRLHQRRNRAPDKTR